MPNPMFFGKNYRNHYNIFNLKLKYKIKIDLCMQVTLIKFLIYN